MPPTVALAILAVVLVVSAYTDVRYGRIYNVVTYPALAVALIGHGVWGGFHGGEGCMGLLDVVVGFAAGFGSLLAVWLAGGIGAGDVKLMGTVGALAGWRFALAAMFYGFAFAALMALIVLLHRRILWNTVCRVGRFLVLAMTPGKGGNPATADSPKIPFGFALCLGSAAAMSEVLIRGPAAAKLILGI